MKLSQWIAECGAWLLDVFATEPMRACTRFELQAYVADRPDFTVRVSSPNHSTRVVSYSLGNTVFAQYEVKGGEEGGWLMRKDA